MLSNLVLTGKQTGERGLMAYRVFPDAAILILILVHFSSSNILGTVGGEEREVCEGGVCDSSEASMWADEADAAGGQRLLALSFFHFGSKFPSFLSLRSPTVSLESVSPRTP